MNYTVVVGVQNVRLENNPTRIGERQQLHVFRTVLPYNKTWH